MRSAAELAALVGVGLALAGCGDPAPPAPGSWFPRVAGASWVYELDAPSGRSEVRVEALGEREIAGLGRRVFLVEETRRDDGPFDAVNPVGYVVDDGYVARIADLVYDRDGRLRVLGKGEATWMLPLAPRPGLRWMQETGMFAAGGDDVRLRWGAEVRTGGTVDVPAGHFADVVEVHTTVLDAEGVVVGRYRDTFARDVGLVCGVTVTGTGESPHVEELRLLRYRVPAPSTSPR